jgi:hypothetical protein
MANQKLTDKTVYASNLAADDKLMLVDTSDTTGSADGTSKQVDNKFIIQTDKVTISNAEYLALHTTAKELVAQPGSGKLIVPLTVTVLYTEGATANTSSSHIRLGFKDIGGGTYYWDSAKNWSKSPGYNAVSWVFSGGSPSPVGAESNSIENQKFVLWVATAPLFNATGTADVYVTYQIAKV